jgi:hypothetical protein
MSNIIDRTKPQTVYDVYYDGTWISCFEANSDNAALHYANQLYTGPVAVKRDGQRI